MTNRPNTLAEIEADPAGMIERKLAADPTWSWAGRFTEAELRRQEDGEAKHAQRRAEATGPWQVAQLLLAARFIDQAPRLKRYNRQRSTYGWKHVVELWSRTHPEDAGGRDQYCGEGSFMLAAELLGLDLRYADGAWRVNLAERVVRDARSAQPRRYSGAAYSAAHPRRLTAPGGGA